MKILVYGRPDCVQCEYTTKKLDEKSLIYTYFDIEKDAEARKLVQDSGVSQLPMVVVKHANGRGVEVWHGFHHEKIKGLTLVNS